MTKLSTIRPTRSASARLSVAYMKTFRMALPAWVRAGLNRHLDLPRPEEFFATGGADQVFLQ